MADGKTLFADFSLELLGGNPINVEKLNATLQSEWPSRVMTRQRGAADHGPLYGRGPAGRPAIVSLDDVGTAIVTCFFSG